MVIKMDLKIKKTIKKCKNKISGKKDIATVDGLKVAVQDIFAHFLQKMYDTKLANYSSVKDLSYDYSEILILFFEGKNEKLLKKLIFQLFIPFLYAELTVKERNKVADHVVDLHKRFDDLYKELQLGKKPIVSFRKVYLPNTEKKEE